MLLREGKIWVYKNKVLVTDPPGCLRIDAVLPLCHENRFLVEHMSVPVGGTVLDLCTGSGVLSVFAAEKASSVVGVDISTRALQFAALNSQLNGVDHKIEWRLGDLFSPVRGMRFDAIIANPPFEPTPDGCSNYLHSNGGQNGVRVIREIIEHVPEYLEEHGSFQMMAWLPATSSSVLDGLSRFFGSERVFVRSLFNFSLTDYMMHRKHAFQADRLPTVPSNNELLHYVYIEVIPTEVSTQSRTEVYDIDKTISFAGAVV